MGTGLGTNGWISPFFAELVAFRGQWESERSRPRAAHGRGESGASVAECREPAAPTLSLQEDGCQECPVRVWQTDAPRDTVLEKELDMIKRLIKRLIRAGVYSTGAVYHSGKHEIIDLAIQCVTFNRVHGDYFEFGVAEGGTFIVAHGFARDSENPMHFYLFDSFEGLPACEGVDADGGFEEGEYASSLETVRGNIRDAGIPADSYTPVQGFYDQSLTAELSDQISCEQAAVIYFDCDLYSSTRTALFWSAQYLQTGTILCFDDYFCFKADPNRGQQKAIQEFLVAHPKISLTEYHLFAWHGKSFVVRIDE